MRKKKNKIHQEDTTQETQEINEAEVKSPTHTKKAGKSGIKIVVSIIILLSIILGGAYYYYESTHYVSTDDAFIIGRPVYITPRISDYVLKVNVINNQHVQEGDILVEIDPRNYELAVDVAKSNVEIAKAKLNGALAAYEVTVDAQNTAAIDMSRNQILIAGDSEGPAISQEKFEHSISAYQASVSEVELAKAGIMLAKAQLLQAEVTLGQANLTLSYAKIYAPVSGYVTKRNIEPGSYLEIGNPVMAIVSDNDGNILKLR